MPTVDRDAVISYWRQHPDLRAPDVVKHFAGRGVTLRAPTLRKWRQRYMQAPGAPPAAVPAAAPGRQLPVTPAASQQPARRRTVVPAPDAPALVPGSVPTAGSPAAVWVRYDEVIPWQNNPRANDDAVPIIAMSIARYGYGRAFVAWQQHGARRLIVGHTALRAVRLLLSQPPVFEFQTERQGTGQPRCRMCHQPIDGVHTLACPYRVPPETPAPDLIPVRWRESWSEAEAAAYAIADNKTGEISDWIDERLHYEVRRLNAIGITPSQLGWPDDEADRLLAMLDGAAASSSDGDSGSTTSAPLPADVPRHQTALSRAGLSSPLQQLVRHGYCRAGVSLLDYGCGRGDDARAAVALGMQVSAYDPHYRPSTACLVPHDVVILAFVLNVIERPAERDEVLRRAVSLARQVVAVGLITSADGDPAGDGVLTSAGTFQKPYTTDEGTAYLRQHVGGPVVALGGGVWLLPVDDEAYALYQQRAARLAAPLDEVLQCRTQ